MHVSQNVANKVVHEVCTNTNSVVLRHTHSPLVTENVSTVSVEKHAEDADLSVDVLVITALQKEAVLFEEVMAVCH